MTEKIDQEEKILKRDGLGRVRTPRQRREAILDEFERSGSSGVQFAELIGVKYPTLASWIQNRQRERQQSNQSESKPRSEAGMWVEAILEEKPTKESARTESLVVELAEQGARMSIATATEAMLAARLLSYLKELQTGGLRHA